MKNRTTRRRAGKRDLFEEIGEGLEALAEAGRGKRILRTHAVERFPVRPTRKGQEVCE